MNRRMSDAGLDYQGRNAEVPWVPTRGEKVFAIGAVLVCVLLGAVGLMVQP